MTPTKTDRRGVTPFLSLLLMVGIVTIGIGMVLHSGLPFLQETRDSVALQENLDTLTRIDSTVTSVAFGGKYSSRTFSFRFERGHYLFNSTSNRIYYVIETGSDIVSTNRSLRIGPVNLTSEPLDSGGRRVEAFVSPDNVTLRAGETRVSPGIYRITVSSSGIVDGRPVVRIEVR